MTKDASVRAGRVLDAQFHLLDRQVLDRNGVPVTVVDDLELAGIEFGEVRRGTPPPVVENLLAGPVLGPRIFGGRPPASRWGRIPWQSVEKIGTAIELRVDGDDLDVTWVERWVRDRIIARIPGGRHDPQ